MAIDGANPRSQRRRVRAIAHLGHRSRSLKQEFIDLYDSFTHGVIDRRTFMDSLTKAAGGTAAALAVIGLLKPNYALAAITANAARAGQLQCADGALPTAAPHTQSLPRRSPH